MTISAIPRDSATSACTRALRNAILHGELKAGERLPPERLLAEQLGVGRVTVRGALAKLEAEHLVSVRHGSGYVVRDYLEHGGPDLIGALVDLASRAKARDIVRDLLRVRRHLARAMFERLLELEPPPDLSLVEDAIDRMEAMVAGDADAPAVASADLEVASALVAATRSAVLRLCLNPVGSVLSRLPDLQRAMFREPEQNVAAWRLILALARDKSAALLDAVAGELQRHDEATLESLDAITKRRKRT